MRSHVASPAFQCIRDVRGGAGFARLALANFICDDLHVIVVWLNYIRVCSSNMATGFEEILAIHHLSEGDLNRVCSKEHRDEFTKRIIDWKAVGAARPLSYVS